MVMLVSLVVVSGCTKMGPDYQRPEMVDIVPRTYQHDIDEKKNLGIDDKWWESFGDPELNRTIEAALKNNLDIKTAVARVLEFEAQLVRVRADRYPAIDFQASAQNQRLTVTTPALTQAGLTQQETRTTIESYSLALPVTYELDLWGRLARANEAARADLLRAEEASRTVAQTVVSEAATLYFQMEALERRIQITKESIDTYRKSLDLVESRYERGLIPILDVRQARRLLAQAESLFPQHRQDLGVAQQRLAVLMGRYPETAPYRGHPEDYFKQMQPVPPGIPSLLLERRPDIRAAEADLKALNARIGVAQASRFPQITLTGSFGFSTVELDRLFGPESDLWNIAAGLLQPVFDAGKRKAGQRAAEAQYQQGVVEYAKTILNAFSEVERSLLTRKEQLERRDRVLDFLREARETQQVAENRYRRGLSDYLTVLEATQTRFQAEENLVLVDLSLLTNRVTIHRALGGGWADPLNPEL
jgi:multidrug efflux system outer membrane protein